MNTLDLILLTPIALGFIFGLFKGLIKELTSLAAIVLGIYGAKLIAPIVANLFVTKFNFTSSTASPLAYLFVFIIIVITLSILANLIDKLFDSMSLGTINKFLGGLFGGLKFALIISVLLNVVDSLDNKFSLINKETKESSIVHNPILKLGPTLWKEVKESRIED